MLHYVFTIMLVANEFLQVDLLTRGIHTDCRRADSFECKTFDYGISESTLSALSSFQTPAKFLFA